MTVPALSNALKGLLTRAGVENPDGDVREILCTVLQCSHTALIMKDEEISPALYNKAIEMAGRRAAGEPIQYVIGSWSFMGRDYTVGKGVLIPRDDTEVVVGEAIKLMKPIPSPAIVDLCSGSGIIAITLYKGLHNATVYAVEKSDEAYAYLEQNVLQHNADIRLIHADLADCVSDFADNSLDMIVSNPPYIRTDEIPTLQSEVQHEPAIALDGGTDGYDFYQMILRLWSCKLKEGGYIAVEIGEGQFETIRDLLEENGYSDIQGYPDIQGITRAVTARRESHSDD